MFYRCFFCFFLFSVFSVRQKNTTQPFSGMSERIFMKLLPNDIGKMQFPTSYRNGGQVPINFWGLKTTQCALGGDAWRMTQKNQFMLVLWLWHCAATAVALQRYEGVNAFNLVYPCWYAGQAPNLGRVHLSVRSRMDAGVRRTSTVDAALTTDCLTVVAWPPVIPVCSTATSNQRGLSTWPTRRYRTESYSAGNAIRSATEPATEMQALCSSIVVVVVLVVQFLLTVVVNVNFGI